MDPHTRGSGRQWPTGHALKYTNAINCYYGLQHRLCNSDITSEWHHWWQVPTDRPTGTAATLTREFTECLQTDSEHIHQRWQRDWTRDQCVTVAQLYTGHSPLLTAYLHRIGRRDSATCPESSLQRRWRDGGAHGLPVPSTRPVWEGDMARAWSVNRPATPVEFLGDDWGGDPPPPPDHDGERVIQNLNSFIHDCLIP